MKIFLSAEAEGPATSKWFYLQKEFSTALVPLNNKQYGSELICIYIISILMREEFFADGGYEERIHYNRSRREADVRLRMHYNTFWKANKQRQREIYIEHILQSIRAAGAKAGACFQTESLITDVKNLLGYQEPKRSSPS